MVIRKENSIGTCPIRRNVRKQLLLCYCFVWQPSSCYSCLSFSYFISEIYFFELSSQRLQTQRIPRKATSRRRIIVTARRKRRRRRRRGRRGMAETRARARFRTTQTPPVCQTQRLNLLFYIQLNKLMYRYSKTIHNLQGVTSTSQ
jgi:hypothetical protein